MLLVHATKGPSAIHGIGLIARQHIPSGALVWRFMKPDQFLTRQEIQSLPSLQVEMYCYYDSDLELYVLSGDDDRFTNHSDTPNTVNISRWATAACRDIPEGEEITWDYSGWR